MTIYIGADHNGFEYKKHVHSFLQRSGYRVVDVGDIKLDPHDDFPDFARKAVTHVLDGAADDKAILICGSGQGMAMAANRFKGVRAALCWNINEARSARNDDDSNVLCLSAHNTPLPDIEAIITAYLATPFAGAARFKRRIEELDRLG